MASGGITEKIKRAYFGIENKYYDFMESLEKHGIPAIRFFVAPIEKLGVPSLPIAALLLLAIVGASFYLSLTLGTPPTKSIAVSVYSSTGEPLDQAVVEIVDKNGDVVATKQSADGKALFENVPGGGLFVRVSKQGYAMQTRSLAPENKELKVSLATAEGELTPSPQGGDGSQMTIKVEDESTGKGVEGAAIEYNVYPSGKEKGSRVTDSGGKAAIPILNSLLAIKASHPDYVSWKKTFKPSASDLVIRLKKKTGGGTGEGGSGGGQITTFTSMGTLTVNAVNETNDAIAKGKIKVYEDGDEIAKAEIAGGVAAVQAPVGSKIYLMGEAEGYQPYNGAGKEITVAETTTEKITFKKTPQPPPQKLVIKIYDDQGQPLTAKIKVVNKQPVAVLLETEDKEWQPEIQAGGYYLLVTADGFFPATKEFTTSDGTVEVRMEPTTIINSGKLVVTVVDEDGNGIVDVKASLFLADKLIAPTEKTDSEGKREFQALRNGETYKIRVRFDRENPPIKIVKEKEIVFNPPDVGESMEERIVLEINDAYYNVSAVDSTTGQPIEASYSTAIEDGTVIDQGTGTNKLLRTRAGKPTTLKVTAAGYLAFQSDGETLEIGQTKKLTAKLTPETAVAGVAINFESIKDAGADLTPPITLYPGKTYDLTFNYSPAQASEAQGMTLVLGEAGNVADYPAAITGVPQADNAITSTAYDPAANCDDLGSGLVTGEQYKRATIEYSSPAQRTATFKITVKEDAYSNQQIKIYYNAFSRKGEAYARDPPDDQATPCNAKLYELQRTIMIGSAAQTPTPTPTAEPAPIDNVFTPSVNVYLDPATGQLVADVDKITLQVDSVFPADAVPINIKTTGDQRIEHSLVGPLKDCYSYDAAKGKLSYKTREFADNAQCPKKTIGNNVEEDAYDSPSYTWTNLTLMEVKTGQSSILRLPIEVRKVDVAAITTAPTALDGGDKTAKIVYVVDEKQAGARELTADTEKIGLASPGTLALAWGGPDLLQLNEGSEPIGSWTYNQQSSYFECVGRVGGDRIDSCSDYLCCASGWCSRLAIAQAVPVFKQKAQEVGSATAFRRGSGEPFKSIQPTGKFAFKTVMQIVQRGTTALAAAGIQVDGGSCDQSKPAIYDVRAESSDGSAWTYKASVKTLDKNLGGTEQKTQLCGFLTGNCRNDAVSFIKSSETPTYETRPQNTDPKNENTPAKKMTPSTTPSNFKDAPAAIAACQAASQAFISARSKTDSACKTIKSQFSSQKVNDDISIQCSSQSGVATAAGLDVLSFASGGTQASLQLFFSTQAGNVRKVLDDCEDKCVSISTCESSAENEAKSCGKTCGTEDKPDSGNGECSKSFKKCRDDCNFEKCSGTGYCYSSKTQCTLSATDNKCTQSNCVTTENTGTPTCSEKIQEHTKCVDNCKEALTKCNEGCKKSQDKCTEAISAEIQAGTACEGKKGSVSENPADASDTFAGSATRTSTDACYPFSKPPLGPGCEIACRPNVGFNVDKVNDDGGTQTAKRTALSSDCTQADASGLLGNDPNNNAVTESEKTASSGTATTQDQGGKAEGADGEGGNTNAAIAASQTEMKTKTPMTKCDAKALRKNPFSSGEWGKFAQMLGMFAQAQASPSPSPSPSPSASPTASVSPTPSALPQTLDCSASSDLLCQSRKLGDACSEEDYTNCVADGVTAAEEGTQAQYTCSCLNVPDTACGAQSDARCYGKEAGGACLSIEGVADGTCVNKAASTARPSCKCSASSASPSPSASSLPR